MRIDRHEMMMEIAEVVAKRGTCDRLQVGAVIARDGRSIASGYNGNVTGVEHCAHDFDENVSVGCETAMHAEANAIAFAARHGVATEGAYIYTTHQPCYTCSRLIINAGITAVFYRFRYRKTEGIELLHDAGVEVYSLPGTR